MSALLLDTRPHPRKGVPQEEPSELIQTLRAGVLERLRKGVVQRLPDGVRAGVVQRLRDGVFGQLKLNSRGTVSPRGSTVFFVSG